MSSDRDRQLLEHRDRQALRMLDGRPGPDCGCGHEGRNHGPAGCCMPGCGCKWPLVVARAVRS